MFRKIFLTIKPSFFWILLFLGYWVITLVIFYHRLPHITTQYGMPDIDTDGGLWYQWLNVYSRQHGLMPEFTNFIAYPFGLDLSYNPFPNLIYTVQVFVLDYVIGFSWQHLMLVTNISSLSTYPLAAISAALLCFYLTKNKYSSFLAGLVYSFTFYHLLSGRGEMSINHIEFIPLYLLSLFYFLDKKNTVSLLLSGLSFGILFNADAYYAFFSGIFSLVIVAFYSKEKLLEKIKTFLIYYPTIFLFLVLLNFEFILSNLFLLNHKEAVATGRNSIARSELTDILYYFSAVEGSFFHYVPILGNFIYSLIPMAYISAAIFLRKNRLYVTLLACVVVAMALTTYVPFFYWINVLYFRYFGIFRGIGKMIMSGYLFIGILLGIALAESMKTKFVKRMKKSYFLALYIFSCAVILIGGLTTDISWYRNGNIEKAANFYTSITKTVDINAVAVYPMRQNGVLICPQPYSEIGQILTAKKLACGASPFDNAAKQHYENIADITNPITIEFLTKYDIDTIFVYNEIDENANKINDILKNDSRLIFKGRVVGEQDNSFYISANDKSRDISVYQVKEVLEKNKIARPTFSVIDGNNETAISFEKINPYEYVVRVPQNSKDQMLTFHSPFSSKWQIYEGDLHKFNDIFFLFAHSASIEHARYQDYENKWKVGKRESTYTIYFKPHAFSYLGIVMSTSTLLLTALSIYLLLKKKKK